MVGMGLSPGCEGAAADSTAPAGDDLGCPAYSGLTAGRAWSYATENYQGRPETWSWEVTGAELGEVELTVAGAEPCGDNDCFHDQVVVVRCDADGLSHVSEVRGYRQEADGEVIDAWSVAVHFDPPLLVLPPSFGLADSWSTTSTRRSEFEDSSSSSEFTSKVTVVDAGDVDVPAGSFATYTLQFDGYYLWGQEVDLDADLGPVVIDGAELVAVTPG